jgi:hypothetical protein
MGEAYIIIPTSPLYINSPIQLSLTEKRPSDLVRTLEYGNSNKKVQASFGDVSVLMYKS